MKKVLLVISMSLTICLMQCSKDHKVNKKEHSASTKKQDSDTAYNNRLVINFQLLPVTQNTTAWLNKINDKDSINLLLALNRVDIGHLLSLDTLLIPDKFYSDLKLYSPFPDSISYLNKIHKLILISNAEQAFAAYENGLLLKWGPSSTGKFTTPTPTGLFQTNWKSKQTISTVDTTWIMNWYINIDNFKGISIHEYSMPGYPASHSCIRLLQNDARWFYYWVDEWNLRSDTEITTYGTPLIVFGNFQYSDRKSWLKQAEYGSSSIASKAALFAEISKFISLILERQIQRDIFMANTEVRKL